MAILQSGGIKAYCVAHIGDVSILTDLSGRENATGFDLGFASRLQSISKETSTLVCSKNILDIWKVNDYFELNDEWKSAVAKDGVEYHWKTSSPKDFESACRKFSQPA